VLEGMGEMGEMRDVVGGWADADAGAGVAGAGAGAAEGGRSLSPAWVEPQQPYQRCSQHWLMKLIMVESREKAI
jgi:hypothetical protein